MLGQSEMNLLVDSRAASKVLMGVTTEVTGEGTSIAPVNDTMIRLQRESWEHFGITQDFHTLAEYFTRLETRNRPAINLGTFVGAGGIRSYVLGHGQQAGESRRSRRDEEARRAGDGGRRARPQHVAPVRARIDSPRPRS